MGFTASREAVNGGLEYAFTAPRDEDMTYPTADRTEADYQSKAEQRLLTREAAVSVREVEAQKREHELDIRENKIEEREKAIFAAVHLLHDHRAEKMENTETPRQESTSPASSTRNSRISSDQRFPASNTARITFHGNGGVMYEDNFVRECLVRPGGPPSTGEATPVTYRFTAGDSHETTPIPIRGTQPPGSPGTSENDRDDEGCKCGMPHVHIVDISGPGWKNGNRR